jgi:hypothetical protein
MGTPFYKEFYDKYPGGMISGIPGDLLALAVFGLTMTIFWFVIRAQARGR